ncbi:flagellar biosynthesis protein FlhF [Pseudoneobacillus rhizosphaerae]|jgi:flagellar biosynthesis protein FlhF|uniref:Flagellar biosynthesis protein FlhF n=1 Tax=Pseudoneobacillus rhizosphaerae TaxID=2880968 RepID=A0A9C7GC27_9BACI|nr:flagellar biosynthesis protein FlhF [Pseudoneobacillus rhizosphaerae]CAG9609764.1 Signal recognition particle receptor FtsY [Pseudoneobacillus rhizosphaerae]
MKTKKIIADSMPLALRMVRQQLGDNAIIVNTRSIKTGGVLGLFRKLKYEVTAYSIETESVLPERSFMIEPKKGIELTTTTDVKQQETMNKDIENNISSYSQNPQKLYNFYAQSAKVEEVSPSKIAEPVENPAKVTAPKVDETNTSKSIEQNEQSEPLLDELKHMRKMMMNFMLNNQDSKTLPSGLVKWINRLKAQGVTEEVSEYIISCLMKKYETITGISDEEIKQEIEQIIQEIFQKRIPESNVISENTRIINVVGPTGVGKTTSIAKLATEQILKQKRRVAMITTDVYRIGAVEQLKTYAGILNVPIEVVRSAEDLEQALINLKNFDLIYMDTTGRNYKEIKYLESVNEFLKQPIESENYLALSLTTKYEDIQILLERFLDSPVKKIILTKFDETSSYGTILNIAFHFPYQIAYITNGQSVPEDITATDPTLLTSYLLGEVK